MSAADIVAGARQYGLTATGWRMETEALSDIDLPVILFWEFNHFVVLERVVRGRFVVNDPANGRRTIDADTFDAAFTGVVLRVEPNEQFARGGRRTGVARALWPWLRSDKWTVGLALAAGLAQAVPLAALPLLLGAFVDDVLPGDTPGRAGAIVWGFVAAGAGMYTLVWLQQFLLRRLAVLLSVEGAQRFVGRLFRLPARFFDQRYAGDLAARAQLLDSVAGGAAGPAVWAGIDLFTSVVLLIVMFATTGAPVAVLVGSIGAANVIATWVLSRRRVDTERQFRHEQSAMLGVEAAGIRDIDNIRATAAEDGFFARWGGHQARELAWRQRFIEMGHVVAALPRLFSVLGAMTVFGVGGWRVMSGDSTVGEMVALYGLTLAFLAPVGRFVAQADSFAVLGADLQRVQDVLDAREDPSAVAETCLAEAQSEVATVRGRLRLAGTVELRDLTFGFRPGHPPLIENLRLEVASGQRVALVGPTGSGKSTALRLINGEIPPWSGEILFDGLPRRDIPPEVLSSSVAAVDQQIRLFAATVRDNLTMWNPTVDDERIVSAARDARIHDEIMRRPSGYESMVSEGGRNFSGGQRQRLEIARALVAEPALLLLDEATSTLDADTEHAIDDSLRRRGMTCIIVAHRLSTIRDCDLIVVLDGGRLRQAGTHEELMADGDGLYRSLVDSQ